MKPVLHIVQPEDNPSAFGKFADLPPAAKPLVAVICADMSRLRALETTPTLLSVARARELIPGLRARLARLEGLL